MKADDANPERHGARCRPTKEQRIPLSIQPKSKKQSSTKSSTININLDPLAAMSDAAAKASALIKKAEKALPLDCNLTEKPRQTALEQALGLTPR